LTCSQKEQPNIAIVSQFKLSLGVLLTDVPVTYHTWGKLNAKGTCKLHGLADVEDWWGPLVGPGLVFDLTLYFIFCANALGSPYGSASPVSINPKTGKKWGPEFPSTKMTDDVNLQQILLNHFKYWFMGGMTSPKWPICTYSTSSQWLLAPDTLHGESAGVKPNNLSTQIPSILMVTTIKMIHRLSDSWRRTWPLFQLIVVVIALSLGLVGSKYCPSPVRLALRQMVILTAQSPTLPPRKTTLEALTAHNNGHQLQSQVIPTKHQDQATWNAIKSPCQIFSAQSYLRYQGDNHDVNHERGDGPALLKIPPDALVIAINSDGLFTLVEQQELANSIPDARLVVVESTDGHNGFLLEFEQINQYVILHLCQLLPHLYGLLGKSNNNKALDFALVASIEAKLLKTIICSEAGGSITNS
ncbi:hypothetical protein PSTT_06410, partial [Puccinia striiformis]